MFSFSSIKFVFKSFAFGVPAGITLIDIFGYVAKVEGSSMQPLLNPDNSPSTIPDFVFLYNWPIVKNEYNKITRGEIVALISPKNPKQRLIKRVIGVPGDLIQTGDNKGSPTKCVKVPQGHVWVEGDHRGRSYDSTVFGPVALGLVKSQARAIVWPPTRWQMLYPHMLPDRVPLNLNNNNNWKEIQDENNGAELISLSTLDSKPPPIL